MEKEKLFILERKKCLILWSDKPNGTVSEK